MATIDAAAEWRAIKLVTFAACAAVVGFALGGCGTTSTNIFSAASGDSATQVATPAASVATSGKKIAIAPVIGAPDVIAKHLQTELGKALTKSQIAVASSPGDAAAYTLRGYIVSAREKANTKISYIWDVTDGSGKRVNRITGEELAPAASGGDPWAAMSAKVVQAISTKTATSLASWLPTQGNTAAAATAQAVSNKTANAAGSAATGVASTLQNGAAGAATGTTTGSIGRAGQVAAIIPNVTGAPGDGGVSLTKAMRNQLTKNGVSMASNGTAASYKVVGRVDLGAGKSGKQPISINWDVVDPSGRKLGTVSQKNEIPQGSLNGAWGQTADAAAAAATQGILKLLPKPTSAN